MVCRGVALGVGVVWCTSVGGVASCVGGAGGWAVWLLASFPFCSLGGVLAVLAVLRLPLFVMCSYVQFS